MWGPSRNGAILRWGQKENSELELPQCSVGTPSITCAKLNTQSWQKKNHLHTNPLYNEHLGQCPLFLHGGFAALCPPYWPCFIAPVHSHLSLQRQMYKDLQGQHWHCIAQGPASLMWIFWNTHLRIQFGQDLWSPFKGFGCYPWWLWQVLQVLLVYLFQVFQVFYSCYTSFVANLSLNQYLSIASFVYINTYKNKVYEHMCISIYAYEINVFPTIPCLFFAQSNALTAIMQESPSSCRQAPSPVSIRLWSKSLLVLIWDKGALSLFSWRVAMATWHKDISIAG